MGCQALVQLNPSIDFLDAVQTCWEEARSYLVKLQQESNFDYFGLVACHIIHAVRYCGDAFNHIREGKARSQDWV